MKYRSSSDYVEWIRDIRKQKLLHTEVEERLISLLDHIVPDYHPIKEPQGLAGGRNDLMLFEFSGRKVLFEIFASKSQVSRDLRILDKTKADIKIAIIIDQDIDRDVFNKFLMENPEDNYPFLFIGELFESDPTNCYLKLKELILGDDLARVRRILQTRFKAQDFYTALRSNGVEVLTKEDIASGDITYLRVFVTILINNLLKMGISPKRVDNLGKWLSQQDLLQFILMKMIAGMNVLLYTDLDENMAIYSDIEITDWIRAMHLLSDAYIIVPLNPIVYEIQDKYLKMPADRKVTRDVSIYVGSSSVYESSQGRSVHVYLPKQAHSIKMFIPPAEAEQKTEQDYFEIIDFYKPGSIIEE